MPIITIKRNKEKQNYIYKNKREVGGSGSCP
jgi:hypothetical protein